MGIKFFKIYLKLKNFNKKEDNGFNIWGNLRIENSGNGNFFQF